MTNAFQQAAADQYRRTSFYVVFLVSPNGERERVARTQRKSGSGLLQVMRGEKVQTLAATWPNMDAVTFKKFADRVEFSNGWRLEFGGTIREEAANS